MRLDRLSRNFADERAARSWREVIDKLGSGDMPPEEHARQPTAAQRGRVVAWATDRIRAGEQARLARRERVSFYRLTRAEYANSIRDLLAVEFPGDDASGLPADDDWRGISRLGAILTVSAAHVEKYLAAGEAILAEAYPARPPVVVSVHQSALDLVGGAAFYGESRYRALHRANGDHPVRVDLWPGQSVRTAPVGQRGQAGGMYRLQIQLSGLRAPDGRPPHLVVRVLGSERVVYESDVTAPETTPRVIEFDAHLPAGPHTLVVSNEVPGPAILPEIPRSARQPFYSLQEGHFPWQLPLLDGQGRPLHPVLMVDSMQWSGPIVGGATTVRQQYMPDPGASEREIESRLSAFAERAFRRPLRPGELRPYLRLAREQRAAGHSLRASVKVAMLAILCSPSFLYLIEGSPARQTTTLTDWELASRLSYFLWSSMPDDELRRLAKAGRLHERAVLRAQVARMLADPRAEQLARSFSRQWLQLDRLGDFTPDSELYPEYDAQLELSMARESMAFFGEVLDENLSLREFLFSAWTMLDERLARHYGIPGVRGDAMRRVVLPPGSHRGGVVTQGAILTLTSDGIRHRPVHRGVWLLEAIFGESPLPPPADIEPIEPNPGDASKHSVRAQIEAHRRQSSCAACHRQIDPLGFAFDHYDAIGRWRMREHVPTGVGADPLVDARGTLVDGRSFAHARGLQMLMLDDIDHFNVAFMEKLATYALRRAMTVDDQRALGEIATQSKANDYRVRDLIESLVLSELFRGR